MSPSLDEVVASMVDGARAEIEPTGMAKLLKAKVDRSERRKARRLLERAALTEAAAKLTEVEEQLVGLEPKRHALMAAEADLARFDALVFDLRQQHDVANDRVRGTLGSESMHSAADDASRCATLLSVAEVERGAVLSRLDGLRSEFDEEQYADRRREVDELRKAVVNGAAALRWMAGRSGGRLAVDAQYFAVALSGAMKSIRETRRLDEEKRGEQLREELLRALASQRPRGEPTRPPTLAEAFDLRSG